MTCAFCNKAYDGVKLFINCEGRCAKSFHIDCVKVSKSNHKLFTTNKQYKWFCKDCSNTTLMNILNELQSLSSEVRRLSSLIVTPTIPVVADLEDTSTSLMVVETATEMTVPVPNVPEIEIVNEVVPLTSHKRTRSASTSQVENVGNVDEITNFSKKQKNSSKTSKPATTALKKKLNSNSSSSNPSVNEQPTTSRITVQQLSSALESTSKSIEIAPLSAVEANKWIFISRLSPETTEAQVIHHLKSNLQINSSDIICNKLIKRGIPSDRISYMSFKVGLKASLFDQASIKSFWPSGSIVHEFKSRSKNYQRLPAVPSQSEGRH